MNEMQQIKSKKEMTHNKRTCHLNCSILKTDSTRHLYLIFIFLPFQIYFIPWNLWVCGVDSMRNDGIQNHLMQKKKFCCFHLKMNKNVNTLEGAKMYYWFCIHNKLCLSTDWRYIVHSIDKWCDRCENQYNWLFDINQW